MVKVIIKLDALKVLIFIAEQNSVSIFDAKVQETGKATFVPFTPCYFCNDVVWRELKVFLVSFCI